MKEIYLHNPLEEAKRLIKAKKKNGDIGLYDDAALRTYRHIYDLYDYDMEDTAIQAERIKAHIISAFANKRYAVAMLSQNISFRINKKSKDVYQLPIIEFMYLMILVAPLNQHGVKLTEEYVFNPNSFKISMIDDYINMYYISKNADKFTFEEACEAIQFIRVQFDKKCHMIGHRLMNTFSMLDIIKLMDRSEDARDIIMVNYDFPTKATPKDIENLADDKKKKLTEIINIEKGGGMQILQNFTNQGQFKEVMVLLGNKPDLYGSTLSITSPTNNIKGFTDPYAYMTDGMGGRKAEIIKLNVSSAGAFERGLGMVCADLRYVDPTYACDSPHYMDITIKSGKDLKNLEGRYYLLDDKDPDEDYKVIGHNDIHLLNKVLHIKTPMTCAHPNFHKGVICRGCYTELLTIANQRVHIGLNSSYSASDNTQQIMLGGKHLLSTNTHDVEFAEVFSNMFTITSGFIMLNEDTIDELVDGEYYDNYQFFFNSKNVVKRKDGEINYKNRSIDVITVYNKTKDEYIVIEDKSECTIFLSSEFSKIYKKYELKAEDDMVYIPFSVLLDEPESPIFEIEYKNNDLTEPLLELESIINTKRIEAYKDPVTLLLDLIPLFNKAGINMPWIHMEIVISRLLRDKNYKYVDWSEEDPQFRLIPYSKAILESPSAVTSIIYRNVSKQLKGNHGFYEKNQGSIFDRIIKS